MGVLGLLSEFLLSFHVMGMLEVEDRVVLNDFEG